jgi:predicted cation transporter
MLIENLPNMRIRIGKLRIDTQSRISKHREHLWHEIRTLRDEIIEIVLVGALKNRISVKELKHKAALIKKYSRRLKLLHT